MKYTRKGEEVTKKCESCDTCWRDSWLERYQDPNECPFCGAEWVDKAEIRLSDVKLRPKNGLYYARIRLIKAEEELEIAQQRLIQLESTALASAAAMHGWDEGIDFIRSRHIKDLGKIAQLRIRCVTLRQFIAEINGQIDKFRDIYARKGEN